MREAFDRLKSVLEGEGSVLEELLATAHEENEALVAGDHDRFLASVREQERLLGRMHDLDRGRAESAQQVAVEVGANPNSPLLVICARLPEPFRSEGKALHERIRGLAEQLAAVNAENDVLIRQALHTTQHSIALLTGIAEQEARKDTYAPSGHGRSQSAAVLDRKV